MRSVASAPPRAATTPQRTDHRGWLIAVVAALLAVVIAGHRLVPDAHGLGSLVDTCAPWFGLGIPLLLGAAVLRRSRSAALAVAVPLLAWAVVFGTSWLPGGGGPVELRVASQNLRAGNSDPAATARAVAATGADLIGFEEVTDTQQGAVGAALDSGYPHHVIASTVELWSRYPVLENTGVDLGLGWVRALRAVVGTPGGDIAVYVVHLGSARPGDTAERDRTMTALVARVRADPAPRLIVLGDLNTSSTDRVLAPLTATLTDTQQAAGRGPGFTWPSAFPMARPDHVLCRGLTTATAQVVRTPGSDHRAITAGLRY